VFPELERVRLAQWAAVEAWDQGVSASAQTLKTASAQALKSAGAPDVWLSAIAPRLAAVSDAKGKDMDDLRLAIQKALNQPGPGHMDNIVQSRLAPARGKFELNWEGYVAVDPDGSRMPRIEFQRWVRSWASSYKALPPPTVIEPVVENGVSLTPLSGALAVLANDAASDLPVPLWSGVRTRKALEQLGAFDPGGHWDDGQGSRLQARLAAGARLKCRMQERLEAAATPALSKAKSRGRARGRAKAGRRRKGRSRKAAVKPKPADKGVEISVCLVRDGKTGPWVTKFFKDQQLMDAPNWMAAQALQLSGFILPEQDARRLDQPLLKTAADLQEFAGALGGHDFTYGQMAWYERTYQWTRDGFTGQAQWFARLYDRNPSLSMLNYGTINPAYGGSNRWDLYPDLLKQEPWNWQARLDYARHLMYTDQRQKALHQLVGLLEMDPGQVDVLKAMAQDLSEMGFFGEGIQVSDAALSLTARSASTLVFAAEQELDWAWDWRGDGGVDTVSAQGGLFLDLGAIRAKALAQEARTKAPAYAPACAALLRAGMALGDPGSEEDAILKASAQADPGYEPSFQVRAQQLLPKWYGSEDKELAFAKEWAGQLWSLPVSARTALAFGDGDQSKGKAYLAQDTVWREIQDAELGRLKDHPWDVDAAAELGYWAQVAGRQDQSLAALSSGLWRDPGAGAWTDLQTVAFTDGMASGADLPADPAAEAASGIAPQYRRAAFYSKSPNLWTLRARAMQALSARYPENLDFLNDLAGLSWRLKQRASCQWAMQRLGARREDQYWTADEFKQAQQWLSSKQGPETRS